MKLGSRDLVKERPESKYWFISPRGSLGGAEEMSTASALHSGVWDRRHSLNSQLTMGLSAVAG